MGTFAVRVGSVLKAARDHVRRSFSAETSGTSEDELLPPIGSGVTERMWMRNSLLSEVSLVVLVFLASLLESAQPLDPVDDVDWTAGGWIAINVVCSAAITLRKRAPVWVLIALGVAGCLLIALGQRPLYAPIVVVLYSVAVYSSFKGAVFGAIALYGTFIGLQLATGQLTSNNFTAPVALVIALLIGLSAGNRRKYIAAVVDRSEQLTRERAQQTELARAAERSRIARELHDIVAHSLSVMIRLSDGAAAVSDTDPAGAGAAIRQVGVVGRASLNDMRRLLGVLRDEDGRALTPQPRLDDLDELIDSFRSAGLPVTLRMHGTFPASGGVQLVIYRAVQESLTNALRYSEHPISVVVDLHAGRNGVTIDVTDDGRNRGASASEGMRRGLIGLRERAAMYGGTLAAGPRSGEAGSGWSVHMTLPQAKEEEQ